MEENKKKNNLKLLWIVLVVCVVGAISFWALLYIGITSTFTESEPYQVSLQLALSDKNIGEKLGYPIDIGKFPSGKFVSSNLKSEAVLKISLTGTKQSGTLYVEATKFAGKWKYDELLLIVDETDERIELINSLPDSLVSK